MSRKHFIALAYAIAGITNKAERRHAALLIADVCQGFNDNFDRELFLLACNV